MKIACVSDVHGDYRSLKLPDAEVLVMAGDILAHGKADEIPDLERWVDTVINAYKYKRVIIVPGNHDTCFDVTFKPEQPKVDKVKGAVLLIDESYKYKGLNFYGSPWVVPFGRWAFQLPENELIKKFDVIPTETNVLITHSPAYGILDSVESGGQIINAGSKSLREVIRIRLCTKLSLHVFGHLHLDGGTVKLASLSSESTYVAANVAQKDERYKTHPRVVVVNV